jgi:hypothetical protein
MGTPLFISSPEVRKTHPRCHLEPAQLSLGRTTGFPSSFISVGVIKYLDKKQHTHTHTHTHTDLHTGKHNVDNPSLTLFPDDSRLYQVDKANTHRSPNSYLISRKEKFGGWGTVNALKHQPKGQVSGWATRLAHNLCPLEVRGQGSGRFFSRKAPFASG